MKKLATLFSIIAFLGLVFIFIGLITMFWLGMLGVKILATGLAVFAFFALLYSVASDPKK